MTLEELFHGPNSALVAELYNRYLQDRDSVDPAARALFEALAPYQNGLSATTNGGLSAAEAGADSSNMVAAANFAQAIRLNGHLGSKTDPLGHKAPGDKALRPEFHGLTDGDLAKLPASIIKSPVSKGCSSAGEAIEKLRKVYSSFSGYDFQHIYYSEERGWIMDVVESGMFRPPVAPVDLKSILEQLSRVEALEKFLHKVFPGKFRFSIEGIDMLVPMLNEFTHLASNSGVYHITLGMAHRGRLNVMHHVMDKPYKNSLIKFKDPVYERDFRDDMGWTGDVKYHEGAVKPLKLNGNAGELSEILEIVLAPNPSHLESVNPVIQGMARGAGTDSSSPGAPKFEPTYSMPVVVHGDAAFPGQGINAETLNMSLIPGYSTGGTLHIITNNQIGYTTIPKDSRSTLYSSDLVKGFEVPVIHVNTDEPEACMEAVRIAFAYIRQFQKDFLIDLIGYRRHGHNEGDEPGFTQPLLYEKIRKHPTAREILAERCVGAGVMEKSAAEKMFEENIERLTGIFESLPSKTENDAQVFIPETEAAKKVKTAFPAAKLKEISKSLLELPEGLSINYKIRKSREKRRDVLSNPKEPTIDWAMGEELAYASILADGVPIRLSGQDCQRGTFSHRHAVLHDPDSGKEYAPLQNFPQSNAAFEIINSPLTENACIGFEYGYSIQKPGTLIIWEAQYGDFINGAQPLIDEYLVSGRSKWGQLPSLVLLLPHAYEGQGPDHSSARLERFLDMAAEKNMRVVNCTSSAQFFHVMRRQAAVLKKDPLPLVVMTPKSLLRNPLVSSSLNEFSSGRFMPIIDDSLRGEDAEGVRRVILCSGKVAIDLEMSEMRKKHPEIAVIRVEQLYYPPVEEIGSAVKNYSGAKEIVWLQEEPINMGAWGFLNPYLRKIARSKKLPLHVIARKRNSSPAEGSMSMHKVNQAILMEQAFSAKEIDKLQKSGVTMATDV